ncbi:AEC family transporter [Draconibacterium sp.]
MAHFFLALKSVLPLFLVILAGLVFSRTKAASTTWIDILNKYALWIGFPALVIASLMHLELSGQSYSSLITTNSVYIVSCMFLAFPIARIFKLTNRVKRSLFLIISFGNVAYLGIPVLNNAYGEPVLPIAAIISAVYVFWLLTLGIILIEINGKDKLDAKKLFFSLIKNPLLVSVFVGLAIVFFNIKLPEIAEKTILLFSNSVTAVVLFSLGIFLGLHKVGEPREWLNALVLSVLTILILPFVYYLAIRNMGMDTLQFKATILDSAMPLGLTPYAISVQYNLEVPLVSRIVVLATLLAIFVIPLWMVVLG